MISLNVLAWNGEEWLRPCLDSLLASATKSPVPARILVIDNGSRDGTAEILRSYGGRIDVLPLPRNEGFAGGSNRGIARAMKDGADWIALLNQDLRVDPGWIAPLLEASEARPRAAVLSPFQYDYEGRGLDPAFRRTLTFLPEAADGLATGRWPQGFYLSDMATGAAILLRRRTLERIGAFDPAYFAYHEEADFYNRVLASGGEILLVPASRVFHWHTLRRGRLGPKLAWINVRNFYRLLLKDPRRTFLENIRAAAGAWREEMKACIRQRRVLRLLLHGAIGLLDLPPRLPAIFRRRAREMRWIEGRETPTNP
jgi:GT2 family glycosyltransferase